MANVLSFVYCMGFNSIWFFVYVSFMTAAFYVTMWEHHYTGVFFSGHIGSNETMILYILIYTLLFFAQDTSWIVYGEKTVNVAIILFVAAVIGSSSTAIGCLIRVKKNLYDVALFVTTLSLVGFWNYFTMQGNNQFER